MHTLTHIKDFTAGTDLTVGTRRYPKGTPLCLYRHAKHGRTFIQSYDGPFIFIKNQEYFQRLRQIGIRETDAVVLSGFKPIGQSLAEHVKPVALLPGSPYCVHVKEVTPQPTTNQQTEPNMAKKNKKTETANTPPPAPPAPPVDGETPPPPAPPAPPVAEKPIKPEVPKQPSANGVTRPGDGTTTRKVWEISDEQTKATGAPAKRADVVAICAAQGINASTATTQYGKWSKYNGYVGEKSPGRSAKPAPAAPAPGAPVSPPPATVDPAFQAGYDGYNLALTGVTVANPNAAGSPEAELFGQGWNQAHADKTAADAAAAQ